MNCTFASNSEVIGCEFRLTQEHLGTSLAFFLPRTSASSVSSSQCNLTMATANSYIDLFALSRDADGSLDRWEVPIILQPVIIEDAGVYTSLTGCAVHSYTTAKAPATSMSESPICRGCNYSKATWLLGAL